MRAIKLALLAGVFGLSFSNASGQSLISMYNFDRVGEFHLSNPVAYQPYRVVVGLPAIGGVSAYVHNSSFELDPVLGSELDGNESIEYILNNIKVGDRLLVDQQVDLMYVGFRAGNGFWSMGARLKTQVNFQYPIELLNLLYYGSVGVGDRFTMDNYDTQVNSYLSYHIGYQHELLDGRLRVGGRFKYLSGLAHASTPNVYLDATFDSNEWNFNTDIEARVASIEPRDSSAGTIVSNNPMAGVFSDNRGYAFDFGASYEVIPGLELSFAAIDVGSITWKTNTSVYRSKGNYTWDGQDVTYPGEGEEFNGEEIVDEIIAALEFEETEGEEFTVALPRSIILGAHYDLTAKHAFAATYQLNQWGESSYHNMGVSYIGNWSKWFSFYSNYAIIDGDDLNVGVGFSANLGPIQIYLLTDDVLTATFQNLNMANIRFGVNIALYRNDLKGYSVRNPVSPSPMPESLPTTPASSN